MILMLTLYKLSLKRYSKHKHHELLKLVESLNTSIEMIINLFILLNNVCSI